MQYYILKKRTEGNSLVIQDTRAVVGFPVQEMADFYLEMLQNTYLGCEVYYELEGPFDLEEAENLIQHEVNLNRIRKRLDHRFPGITTEDAERILEFAKAKMPHFKLDMLESNVASLQEDADTAMTYGVRLWHEEKEYQESQQTN